MAFIPNSGASCPHNRLLFRILTLTLYKSESHIFAAIGARYGFRLL